MLEAGFRLPDDAVIELPESEVDVVESPVKVATPFLAETVIESAASFWREIVTGPLKLVATLPN